MKSVLPEATDFYNKNNIPLTKRKENFNLIQFGRS